MAVGAAFILVLTRRYAIGATWEIRTPIYALRVPSYGRIVSVKPGPTRGDTTPVHTLLDPATLT